MNTNKLKKVKHSTYAISPVISVLLMIAIAVVASLVAYAWIMGYMNFQTGKIGDAIQIPSYALDDDSNYIWIYVQNVGQSTVTVGNIYIDNQPVNIDTTRSDSIEIQEGKTAAFYTNLNDPIQTGKEVNIKVVTTSGTYAEIIETISSETSNPTPEWILTATGKVDISSSFDLNQIKAMQSTTIMATLKSSGHPEENGVFQFTGVTLWSLLQQTGIENDAVIVRVKASDGFSASLLVEEIQENSERILLAYMKDGQMIKAETDGGEGPLRLVVGSDTYASRWVKYVSSIEVI